MKNIERFLGIVLPEHWEDVEELREKVGILKTVHPQVIHSMWEAFSDMKDAQWLGVNDDEIADFKEWLFMED